MGFRRIQRYLRDTGLQIEAEVLPDDFNLSPVLHEMDGLLRDGTLILGNNNLLKAHFLNVAVKQSEEDRKIRPVKIDPRTHIDGFVAVCDALTVRQKWMEQIGEQLKNED